jgi:hypothetical protein
MIQKPSGQGERALGIPTIFDASHWRWVERRYVFWSEPLRREQRVAPVRQIRKFGQPSFGLVPR